MNNITIKGAQLRFRNFSGKAGKFNAEGQRNFCVLIGDDLAPQLKLDKWNIKYLKPHDDQEAPQAYLPVKVNFNGRPPRIVLKTVDAKGNVIKSENLNEDTVAALDYAEIKRADVVINPYEWEMGGNTGVTAYVEKLGVTIEQDEFDAMYCNIPDSAKAPSNLDEFD